MLEKFALTAHISSTFMMTGIIWLIQLVHYPLFKFVGKEKYSEFHIAHMNWITPIVAPTMIVELLTAIYLVVNPPENVDTKILWFGATLVAVVWASTFFLQVPLHEKLAQGFDSETHAALVNTNWIRTIGWTFRGAIVCYFVWKTVKI